MYVPSILYDIVYSCEIIVSFRTVEWFFPDEVRIVANESLGQIYLGLNIDLLFRTVLN